MIEIPAMTIVLRAVFHENKKYYTTSFFETNICAKIKLKDELKKN